MQISVEIQQLYLLGAYTTLMCVLHKLTERKYNSSTIRVNGEKRGTSNE